MQRVLFFHWHNLQVDSAGATQLLKEGEQPPRWNNPFEGTFCHYLFVDGQDACHRLHSWSNNLAADCAGCDLHFWVPADASDFSCFRSSRHVHFAGFKSEPYWGYHSLAAFAKSRQTNETVPLQHREGVVFLCLRQLSHLQKASCILISLLR
jgi:hypothetical protein